jgi:hypothetical protein
LFTQSCHIQQAKSPFLHCKESSCFLAQSLYDARRLFIATVDAAREPQELCNLHCALHRSLAPPALSFLIDPAAAI